MGNLSLILDDLLEVIQTAQQKNYLLNKPKQLMPYIKLLWNTINEGKHFLVFPFFYEEIFTI